MKSAEKFVQTFLTTSYSLVSFFFEKKISPATRRPNTFKNWAEPRPKIPSTLDFALRFWQSDKAKQNNWNIGGEDVVYVIILSEARLGLVTRDKEKYIKRFH